MGTGTQDLTSPCPALGTEHPGPMEDCGVNLPDFPDICHDLCSVQACLTWLRSHCSSMPWAPPTMGASP